MDETRPSPDNGSGRQQAPPPGSISRLLIWIDWKIVSGVAVAATLVGLGITLGQLFGQSESEPGEAGSSADTTAEALPSSGAVCDPEEWERSAAAMFGDGVWLDPDRDCIDSRYEIAIGSDPESDDTDQDRTPDGLDPDSNTNGVLPSLSEQGRYIPN